MGLPHLISIVGAGPGDPELLTIKALNRLKEADVILYDALLGDEILAFANPSAIQKYVGKTYNDGQNQTERQDAIHKELLHWAEKGKKAVRLKTGDPMIFARGVEEIRFCRANNLNFEVIPGVTAGLAAASIFSIPITERGKSNMVAFYTATRQQEGFHSVDPLFQILKTGSSVVVYMGLNHLLQLAFELIEKGADQQTPVIIAENVSRANQNFYKTSLAEVDTFLKENKPCSPAVIIIGEHVEPI